MRRGGVGLHNGTEKNRGGAWPPPPCLFTGEMGRSYLLSHLIISRLSQTVILPSVVSGMELASSSVSNRRKSCLVLAPAQWSPFRVPGHFFCANMENPICQHARLMRLLPFFSAHHSSTSSVSADLLPSRNMRENKNPALSNCCFVG